VPSIPVTAFISGAIAIAIGVGTKNIINNFISGWILGGVDLCGLKFVQIRGD